MSERSPVPTTVKSTTVKAKASQLAAWRDIGRMFGLSLRYWESLVAVVLLGTVEAANRFVRMWIIQPVVDDAIVPVTANDLSWSAVAPILEDVGLVLAASLVVTPLAVLGRNYFAEWSAARVRQRVDLALARKFLHLPLSTVRDGSSGDFMARCMSDAQIACQAVTRIYKDVVLNVQLVIGGIAVMLWISVPLTIVALVAVPPFWALLTIFMGRVLTSATRRQETQGDLSDRLVAILSGIKVIKAFRGEDVEQDAFDIETGKYFRRNMKMMKNGAIIKALTEAMWATLGIGVMGAGAWAVVTGTWDLTLGAVLAFGAVQSVVHKPLKNLIQSGPRLLESAGSAKRLFEILDLPEEVADRPDARPLDGIRHGIRFRDVAFDYYEEARGAYEEARGTYEETRGARAAGRGDVRDPLLGDAADVGVDAPPLPPPVLDGIDLEVRAGEVVAIVGRTGAGKSTLVDLLLRFHDPTRGAIEIDGVDLRDLQRASFLDHVALVGQEPFLFDESIRENIRYGRPDATDAEVEAAARAASAHEFIVDDLAEGYDTIAGELGLRLSGGQRQRITIARAILASPALLVFDEATSALDARTERAVQDAIEGLRGERTIFLVAHRLSTIERADRIVVLDAGRIAEVGDHESLIARGGLYAQLIGAQTARAS